MFIKKIHNAVYITSISILLVNCTINPEHVIDQSLPNRDIVFQLDEYYSGGIDNQIGFINSDGSGETYIEYREIQASVYPIWTESGELLFSHPSNYIEGINHNGYRISIRDVWAPESSLIHGMGQILVVSDQEGKYVIKRLNLETGEVINNYKVGEFLIDDSIEGIGLGSNNIHGNFFPYSRFFIENDDILNEELRLFDTTSNRSTVLLHYRNTFESVTRIEKPSLSPDGDWIAYSSNDGIYLIRPDGSENHRIIQYDVMSVDWPPAVSWSPDGKWIVYHKCLSNHKTSCNIYREVNSIFKYNIESEEEIRLYVNGFNPFWRWND